ncbi:UvrD-helicase domain-containing protein [Candidatus Similichlamydia epinepheli]|uniref:UvrD-helicase domain-containing protein n=1 Tax=Candidatus Similichlamydia epinepheli TaxID=1903953 RepID=UPI000D33B624|nr:UvrD-helicase domain-containing protein [Candidatus Similichlamydia epinepheli]
MNKEFDILSRSFKSSGSFLLEASAGTGKTFSIEHLFLRALLEGTCPEEILIMTFTRKASRQLSIRIRKAISFFYGKLSACDRCSNLPEYILDHIEKGSKASVQRFLRMGLESVDRLSIFTIHGFCQFLLQQDPFSNLPSMVDRTNWVNRIGPTYLSRYLYSNLGKSNFPLREEEWDFLIEESWFFSSNRIYQDLLDEESVYPLLHREISWEQTLHAIRTRFSEWNLSPAVLWESYRSSGFPFLGFSSNKNKRSILFNGLRALKSKTIQLKELKAIIKFLSIIGSETLLKSYFGKIDLDWVDKLKREFHREFRCFNHGKIFLSRLLSHLLSSSWWKSIQSNQGAQPDALLTKLIDKIGSEENFLKECQQKFSYVIIDEFQDTDPIQWKIFEKLFFNPSPNRFVLVGDPKQSIYSFRRSDVYTYFKASKALSESYTLETNFRSKSSLVETLNLLFSASPNWMFLPKTGQSIDPIVINAHHKDPTPEQRVHFLSWDGTWKNLFHEISVRIRNRLQQGICPSQIAVLVSRHSMARDLLKEMHGIPVHVSRIFPDETKQVACWLWIILNAIWDSASSSITRLLLTPFFGFDWGSFYQKTSWLELKCIFESNLYKRHQDNFSLFFASFFQILWKGETVLNWFEKNTSLRERLIWKQLIFALFEREKNSQTELMNWVLRLMSGKESLTGTLPFDALYPAIQILTIHSSKGLEFDTVFALGLADRATSRGLDDSWVQVESDGEIVSVIGSSLYGHELKDHLDEYDSEKLRLLYVAMTRAKEHLFVPLPSIKKTGRKLKRGSAAPIELFAARFGEIDASYSDLYDVIEKGSFEPFNKFLLQYDLLAKKVILQDSTLPFDRCLITKSESCVVWKPSLFRDSFTRSHRNFITKKESFKGSSQSWSNWMQIPRGRLVGKFLHDILSHMVISRGSITSNWKKMAFTRSPYPMSEQDQEDLFLLLDKVFKLPLPSLGFSLEEIHPNKCVTELSFSMSNVRYKGDLWTGAIDLLFEKDGVIFLLDWKSNWLGDNPSDYSEDQLKKCCFEYSYKEQIDLYSQALRKKLIGSSHSFGGSFLFFLRAENGLFFDGK